MFTRGSAAALLVGMKSGVRVIRAMLLFIAFLAPRSARSSAGLTGGVTGVVVGGFVGATASTIAAATTHDKGAATPNEAVLPLSRSKPSYFFASALMAASTSSA